MGGADHADPAIHAGEFFNGDGVVNGIEAGAAIFLRIGNPHQAELTHLFDDLVRELIVLIQAEGE